MPQCCRGASGDANTPYNQSCTGGPTAAFGFAPVWLQQPLIFDMAVDVAQAHPLANTSAAYGRALAEVQAVLRAAGASLAADQRHTADYAHDLRQKACCNTSNVVCRCDILPS
jgi:hypothetical protein